MKQLSATKTNQFLLTFLFLVTTVPQIVTASSCPLFCSCEHNISESNEVTSVDCQQHSLRFIPVEFPKDTSNILLKRNLISTIVYGQFSDLENLILIDISYNKIISINEGAFVGLSRLETIDLSENKLHVLPYGMVKNCTNIRTININRNRIRTFSNMLSNSTHLERLYLRQNELSILTDDAFAKLYHLKLLDLRQNKLTEFSFQGVRFPDSIEELQLGSNLLSTAANLRLQNAKNLIVLGLEINFIQDANEIAFEHMTRLQFVNFSSNLLTRVTHTVLSCRSIKILDFSDNRISTLQNTSFANVGDLRVVYLGGNEFINLPNCIFHNNTKLTDVHLERNQLKAVFRNSFCQTDNLSKLYLQDNNISLVEIHDFPNLKILNLTNNEISERELYNIFNLPNVTTLLLSCNNITVLTENSVRNLRALKELNISYNRLISIENSAFINVAGTLKLLDLSQNEIKILMSESFKELSSLERLNLAHNRIDYLPKFIFIGLQKLAVLNISYNFIDNVEGVTFEDLTRVVELDFRGNSIKGLPASIFSTMKSLLKLDLSENFIEEVSQDMFEGLENLRSLNLADNNIHSLSGQPFVNLNNLLELSIRNNKLYRIESDSFQGLSSLITLDLSENDIRTLELNAFQHLVDVKSIFLSNNMIIHFEEILINCLISLEELWLDHNMIENTTSHVQCAWENTRIIDLSFNKIQSIPSKTLAIFPRLDYLDLKSNLMEAVPEIKLGNHLRTLNASNNSMTFLGDYCFENMTDLVELDLSEMCLLEIGINSFGGMKRLEFLNLENNCLTTLNREIFQELLNIRNIRLRKNPWSCDCFLKDFLKMFSGKDKLPMLEKPLMICHSPSKVYLQDALDVPENKMICEPPIVEFVSDVTAAGSGYPLTLICMANGTPEPNITWQGTLSEISKNVQTKRIKTKEGVILISEIAQAQSGDYSCTATNALGENIKTIELQVTSQALDNSEYVLLVAVTAIITVIVTSAIITCCYLYLKHGGKLSRSRKYYFNGNKHEFSCYENKGRDVQEDYVTIGKHYQKSVLTHDVNMDGKWKDVHKRYLSREDMIEFGQYMAERTMGYGVIRRANSDHLYLNGQESSAWNVSVLNASVSESNIDDDRGCYELQPQVAGDYSGPTTPIPLTPLEAAFKYGYGSSLYQDNDEKFATELTDEEIELSMLDDFEKTFNERIQQFDDLGAQSKPEEDSDIISDNENNSNSITIEPCKSPMHLSINQSEESETQEAEEKEKAASCRVLQIPRTSSSVAGRNLDLSNTTNSEVDLTVCSPLSKKSISYLVCDGKQCQSDNTIFISNKQTSDNTKAVSKKTIGHSNEHYQAASDDSNSDDTSLWNNISFDNEHLDVIEAEFEDSVANIDMHSQYDSDAFSF
ncbi:slit homolog 1 protein-like [Anneissia japonica]|uniref:slit homolog 1 protein-like n=1 Tax=Anneissia japonica TaxID=1529436 RepID=UPI0014257019|nr:slit homolog 1 protein-like [Anneissia japonica]